MDDFDKIFLIIIICSISFAIVIELMDFALDLKKIDLCLTNNYCCCEKEN